MTTRKQKLGLWLLHLSQKFTGPTSVEAAITLEETETAPEEGEYYINPFLDQSDAEWIYEHLHDMIKLLWLCIPNLTGWGQDAADTLIKGLYDTYTDLSDDEKQGVAFEFARLVRDTCDLSVQLDHIPGVNLESLSQQKKNSVVQELTAFFDAALEFDYLAASNTVIAIRRRFKENALNAETGMLAWAAMSLTAIWAEHNMSDFFGDAEEDESDEDEDYQVETDEDDDDEGF